VLAGVGLAHMPTFVIGAALASGRLIPIFRDKRNVSSAHMSAYVMASSGCSEATCH
jgi:DNA-binding transcriptional LysR family regulator